MSPELTTILMILSLFVLLAGFPIAFGVGTVGLVFGVLTGGNAYLYMIPMRLMDGILSEYILAAVPLFIFMGTMMQTSGVAERAFGILHKWMGGMNGGLAVATILLAMLFAATTGVVGASETAIGLMAVPAMLNARYSQSLASGCVCAGGTLGILIPPSIMLILYAPMAGVSVLQMFAGAVIPGILLGFSYVLYVVIRCAVNPKLGPAVHATDRVSFFSSKGLTDGFKYLFPPAILAHGGRCCWLHWFHSSQCDLQAAHLGRFQTELLHNDQDHFHDHLHSYGGHPLYGRFPERGVRAGHHGFPHVSGTWALGHFHHHPVDHLCHGDVHRLDRHPAHRGAHLFADSAQSRV
jgi:hypothetical protein